MSMPVWCVTPSPTRARAHTCYGHLQAVQVKRLCLQQLDAAAPGRG
jgi:hypothetical protein